MRPPSGRTAAQSAAEGLRRRRHAPRQGVVMAGDYAAVDCTCVASPRNASRPLCGAASAGVCRVPLTRGCSHARALPRAPPAARAVWPVQAPRFRVACCRYSTSYRNASVSPTRSRNASVSPSRLGPCKPLVSACTRRGPGAGPSGRACLAGGAGTGGALQRIAQCAAASATQTARGDTDDPSRPSKEGRRRGAAEGRGSLRRARHGSLGVSGLAPAAAGDMLHKSLCTYHSAIFADSRGTKDLRSRVAGSWGIACSNPHVV